MADGVMRQSMPDNRRLGTLAGGNTATSARRPDTNDTLRLNSALCFKPDRKGQAEG